MAVFQSMIQRPWNAMKGGDPIFRIAGRPVVLAFACLAVLSLGSGSGSQSSPLVAAGPEPTLLPEYLAVALAASPADAVPPVAVVEGPSQVVPGEIVVLDASKSPRAKFFKWTVRTEGVVVPGGVPEQVLDAIRVLQAEGYPVGKAPAKGREVFEVSEECGPAFARVSSFEGKYYVTVAVGNEYGVDIKVHEIVSKPAVSPPPPDDPDPPTPDPQPPTTHLGIREAVPGWLAKVPEKSRSQKGDLAGGYRAVAGRSASGEFATVQAVESAAGEMLRDLVRAGKVNAADWKAFGDNMNAAITGLDAAGLIKKPQDYGAAMLEIAEGLK